MTAPPTISVVEALLGVDPVSLSDGERIDRLVALEALKARVDAAQVRLLAAWAVPAARAGPGGGAPT